jgi:hypothetical protein
MTETASEDSKMIFWKAKTLVYGGKDIRREHTSSPGLMPDIVVVERKTEGNLLSLKVSLKR